MNKKTIYRAGLYCRLSRDDDKQGESASIGTQRGILTSYCNEHGISVVEVYVDDGYSGLNFQRPDFQRMLQDIEAEKINMVLTKDLSRLGRDYIMTGYYSEIYFPSQGVRYVALGDQYDSFNMENDLAPFKNILNEMYAKDISRKVRSAKRQLAKSGRFIGSYAPYGYQVQNGVLIPDPETALVVERIFKLACTGMGVIAIAKQMDKYNILPPSVHQTRNRPMRSEETAEDLEEMRRWCPGTIRKILCDPVYLGRLISLKTETVNVKAKKRARVPDEQRIVTENAHSAIVQPSMFDDAKKQREAHFCPAWQHRDNLFRGLLYCDCCGHPLSIAHRKLTYREEDLYRCMHHFHHPEACPKTHAIYHSVLYPYVLSQVKAFSKSMRRRKVQSTLAEYGNITELTPEILNRTIERIEIGHVTRKSAPSKVVRIFWKLN